MQSIVVVELYCLLIILIVAFDLKGKNIMKDRRTKMYSLILVATFVSVIIDSVSHTIDSSDVKFTHRLLTSFSYIVDSLLVIPFAYYVYEVISLKKDFSKWFMHGLSIIMALNCAFLFVYGMAGHLFSMNPFTFGQGSYPILSHLIIIFGWFYITLLAVTMSWHSYRPTAWALIVYLAFNLANEILLVMTDVQTSYSLVFLTASELFIYMILQNNITQEAALDHRISQTLANVDGLTGINTRYLGTKEVGMRFARRKPFVMLLLDVDKFKSINDTYGHPVGDLVLKAVAKALQSNFPKNICVRLGGDEFMVIIDGKHDNVAIDRMMQSLFHKIRDIRVLGMDTKHEVSISAGIASYEGEENCGFNELYRMSDQRLYQSKSTQGCSYTAS